MVTKNDVYNYEKAVVFNTIQAYRKDRFDYLTKLHNDLKGSVKIGVKLVHSAYMDKEKEG